MTLYWATVFKFQLLMALIPDVLFLIFLLLGAGLWQEWSSRWSSSPPASESSHLEWRARTSTPLMAWSRGRGTETSSSEVPQTSLHTLSVQIGQSEPTVVSKCNWFKALLNVFFFSLPVLQDRLTQQQKAMVEERAYLKEIISRMDTQLSEQQRQLEKVWIWIAASA